MYVQPVTYTYLRNASAFFLSDRGTKHKLHTRVVKKLIFRFARIAKKHPLHSSACMPGSEEYRNLFMSFAGTCTHGCMHVIKEAASPSGCRHPRCLCHCWPGSSRHLCRPILIFIYMLLFPGPSSQEFLPFMHAGGPGKQDNGSSSDSSADSSSSVGPSMACMFEIQSSLSRTYAEAKDSESECDQNAAGKGKDQIHKGSCMQGKMKHEEQYVSPASSSGLPCTRACIHVHDLARVRQDIHMPHAKELATNLV